MIAWLALGISTLSLLIGYLNQRRLKSQELETERARLLATLAESQVTSIQILSALSSCKEGVSRLGPAESADVSGLLRKIGSIEREMDDLPAALFADFERWRTSSDLSAVRRAAVDADYWNKRLHSIREPVEKMLTRFD